MGLKAKINAWGIWVYFVLLSKEKIMPNSHLKNQTTESLVKYNRDMHSTSFVPENSVTL